MQHDTTTYNMIQQHTTSWSNGTNFFFTTNVVRCCMKSWDRLTGALGPPSINSKISLEDFLSQKNLCHWTSERDCKPAQQWIQHERSISSNTCYQEICPKPSLLNKPAAQKYIAETQKVVQGVGLEG